MSTRYPMMAIMEESTIPEGQKSINSCQKWVIVSTVNIIKYKIYLQTPSIGYLRFSEVMNMLIVTYSEAQTAVWSNQTVDIGGKRNLTHTGNMSRDNCS